METTKKPKLQQFKTASSTVFTAKPSLVSTRQNSKQSSPKKTQIKSKLHTEAKANYFTEGVELAIGSILKKSNQRWSQQKQLPIIKSFRDSQRKVQATNSLVSTKKKGKIEDHVDKIKVVDRMDDLLTEDRRRKFKSLDAYRKIDDEDGDLIVCAHDNIGSRYQVLTAIGRGTFGQVFKAYDHKSKEYVALKVIKNDQKFTTQARIQVRILKMVGQKDIHGKSNIVQVKDSFIFKNHMCITFQLLHTSLYDFLKQHKFQGFSLDLIRRIAIQVLQSLLFLEKQQIVHCDLKPENILLRQQNKSGVKVIDMGSSCLLNQRIYNYIQSRFYRAPEIILGIPYTCAIDMWSFGCILAELSSGQALFPGSNEMQQMDRFVQVLGMPPNPMTDQAPRKKKFFDDDIFKGKRKPGSRKLQTLIGSDDKDFVEIVRRCLEWSPGQRIKPAQALLCKWITDALPEEIREHHVNQIKLEHPELFN